MAPGRGGQCRNGAVRSGNSGAKFHIARPPSGDDDVKGIASPPSNPTLLPLGLSACYLHQCMFGNEVADRHFTAQNGAA